MKIRSGLMAIWVMRWNRLWKCTNTGHFQDPQTDTRHSGALFLSMNKAVTWSTVSPVKKIFKSSKSSNFGTWNQTFFSVSKSSCSKNSASCAKNSKSMVAGHNLKLQEDNLCTVSSAACNGKTGSSAKEADVQQRLVTPGKALSPQVVHVGGKQKKCCGSCSVQ